METIEADNPMWDVMNTFHDDHSNVEPPPSASPCCNAPFEQSEGNVVCRKCFTLLDRQIDYGAEWRFYGAEDQKTTNPTRCCPPSNSLLSQNLGSVISSVQGCPSWMAPMPLVLSGSRLPFLISPTICSVK